MLALAAAGIAISATGQVKAGRQAKQIGEANAQAITKTSELNAHLIEEGTELNAGVYEYNANALKLQAVDAVQRGKETEEVFRKQLKGFIGTQRTGYAAQNVELDSGSPLEVQMDSAKQGEHDALTIRTNAAREAWGYQTAAGGEQLQANATRKLGTLQAKNTRDVGRANALIARLGGNAAQSAANYGAASTIVNGATNLYMAKYGFKG